MATGYGEYTALHRSEDDGETWERCVVIWKGVPDKPGQSSLVFDETSGVVELRDGTLICNGALMEGRNGTSYILRSRDDGRTWGDASVVPDGNPCGGDFLRRTSGWQINGVRPRANRRAG